MRKFQTNTSN